jgi:hypothetical protein
LVALVLKQSRVAPADRIVAGQEFVVELDRGLIGQINLIQWR